MALETITDMIMAYVQPVMIIVFLVLFVFSFGRQTMVYQDQDRRVAAKKPKKRPRNPARPAIRRKSDARLPASIRPEEGACIRLHM